MSDPTEPYLGPIETPGRGTSKVSFLQDLAMPQHVLIYAKGDVWYPLDKLTLDPSQTVKWKFVDSCSCCGRIDPVTGEPDIGTGDPTSQFLSALTVYILAEELSSGFSFEHEDLPTLTEDEWEVIDDVRSDVISGFLDTAVAAGIDTILDTLDRRATPDTADDHTQDTDTGGAS